MIILLNYHKHVFTNKAKNTSKYNLARVFSLEADFFDWEFQHFLDKPLLFSSYCKHFSLLLKVVLIHIHINCWFDNFFLPFALQCPALSSSVCCCFSEFPHRGTQDNFWGSLVTLVQTFWEKAVFDASICKQHKMGRF